MPGKMKIYIRWKIILKGNLSNWIENYAEHKINAQNKRKKYDWFKQNIQKEILKVLELHSSLEVFQTVSPWWKMKTRPVTLNIYY